MTLPLVLVAFVAGSALLQQQAALLASAALIALLVGAPCVAWLGWRLLPSELARRALVLLAAWPSALPMPDCGRRCV